MLKRQTLIKIIIGGIIALVIVAGIALACMPKTEQDSVTEPTGTVDNSAVGTGAVDADITVDYSANEGEMSHIAGGNLHLFDDRTPAGWLSDGVGVYAVRGQAYSNRTDSTYEYLPGFFEDGTYERLMSVNPDVKLMIGLYYGYKGETGDNWKLAAYDETYAQRWADYCVALYNDAKDKGITVYSWIPMNEPDLQWSSDDWANEYPMKFYELAYKAIKEADPDALIQGPELGGFYSLDKLKTFLLYCKENDCLPDILSWHDLKNSQSAIEDDIATIKAWMIENDIEPMEIAITEYQGTGYSTDESGRYSDGNYNTGLAVNYIASIERSEDNGLIAGLRSEWGLSGGNSNARGDMGELCDFDTKQMATGLWYVYNAYWDMTGRKAGVTVSNSNLDALATVDTAAGQSGILIGSLSESETVTVTLENIPGELITDNMVHVQVCTIDETLATPCYGADSLMNENLSISGDSITLEIEMTARQACYIVISEPYKLSDSVSAVEASYTISDGMTATTSNGILTVTGGETSSYVDDDGNETYVETGDSVSFTLSVETDGYYNFTSTVVRSTDGGFMQLYVDGTQVGYPTDLYGTTESEIFNHGNIYLTVGSHTFEFKLVGHGKNASSTGTTLRFRTLFLNALGVIDDGVTVSTVDVSIEEGDTLSLPSTVEVEYSDGTKGTEPVSWSTIDTSAIGTYTVSGTVTIDGTEYATTATVTVTARITGISVTALPAKTVYLSGESFDSTGMVVTASYSDGSSAILSGAGYTVSDIDSSSLGEKTVTVTSTSDSSVTASFTVEVWELSASTDESSLSRIVDGNLTIGDSFRWTSGSNGSSDYIVIDFGRAKSIISISLLSGDDFAYGCSIQTSQDGSTWTEVEASYEKSGDWQIITMEADVRYLKISCTQTNPSYHWWSIYEISVF